MSNKSTPSPRQRPDSQIDESQLPAGHCRYILLVPEVKGQRCGCAHFNLNRSTPGAICECGHLSCYHVSYGEPLSTSENQELTLVKQRLELLEREHVELHQLRRDFMMMQQRIGQNHDRHHEAIVRVSELEEQVEKVRNEVKEDVREAYRNLGRAWDSITDLMHGKKMEESHFRHVTERLQDIDSKIAHIGERQLELVDMDISLEGRIEDLEELEDRIETLEENGPTESKSMNSSTRSTQNGYNKNSTSTSRNPTRASASRPVHDVDQDQRTRTRPQARSPSPAFTLDPSTPKATTSDSLPTHQRANAITLPDASTHTVTAAAADASSSAPVSTNGSDQQANNTATATPPSALLPPAVIAVRNAVRTNQASSARLWTVHVSLLPTSTRPFPFERDTNAYNRCLSRGLHQMVVVCGTSADAFEEAITNTFGRILRGRKWAPLQALPCTAETLAGLPMLRPLDPALLDEPFDMEFLRNHCAVCDINGKIDSLYIAMRERTLSWHSIRRLPVFLGGLEPCWGFDSLLDANDPFVEDEFENDVNSSEDEVMGGMPRPSAGDIVATIPSLKRAASEMSRSSSFGSVAGPSASASSNAKGPAPTSTGAATTSSATATSTPSAAEGEGSRPKVPRIYPLPNMVEVRRGVKTS
ncbi:hypothetical protein SPBR_06914 [Sporothrix brasiliensis 5110]|uniref:Uncharacterized protein n=1 Tax=Sporothrix brasiliensis 5110 TaxID=1398154 RepID=A0A0C2IUN9_9PEZI|nr:uncharacterized protein SPBR_06914 [Sporothrix brasiliensis 5110]KIH88692.1 hypothetical protein SPBR_06914 [Sporothrix brasiliensis 5110]